MFASANYKGHTMNQATLKSRATVIGKVFAAKGITLSRAEQLDIVAQLEGAKNWHHASAEASSAPATGLPITLNSFQKEAARAYCGGDFADRTVLDEGLEHSDRLFGFVIREIGEAGEDVGEAARVIQQASDELAEVAAHLANLGTGAALETLPSTGVTVADGMRLVWTYHFLSDRFGEPQQLKSASPRLQDWLDKEGPTFEAIWQTCLEENAFVAEVNGRIGTLYEMEIETAESDIPDEGFKPCTVSEKDRHVQLLGNIQELEKRHPEAMWAVVDSGGVIPMNRLGVWAFIPHSPHFDKEKARALLESMYAKFY